MKFEQGLRKLEGIVNTLDEGQVTLDQALSLFREGLTLSRDLSKTLDDIERKVEIIIKKDDGSIEKRPFLQDEP